MDLTAHREWANRPSDQRFQSLDALETAVNARKAMSVEREIALGKVRVYPTESGDLRLGNEVGTVGFSNWSFGQLSRKVGAPSNYLETLPAPLAAEALNFGIQTRAADKIQLYGAGDRLQAVTSDRYERIFDADLVALIKRLTEGSNFKQPMGYKDGVWGAEPVPSGLYASDRDVFLFLIDESRPITIGSEVLHRGFYAWNSEVGSKTMGFNFFLYRLVCLNNMIHGDKQLGKISVKHIGDVTGRMQVKLSGYVQNYLNAGTGNEVQRIQKAMNFCTWTDDEEAATFLKDKADITQKLANASVEAANREEGGVGNLWKLLNGMTAVARSIRQMDVKTTIEAKAGKVLEMVTA